MMSVPLLTILIGTLSTPSLPAEEVRSVNGNVRAPQPEVQELIATQQVFRSVSDKLHPSLVRIETVGGAQPRQFITESDFGGEDDEDDRGGGGSEDDGGHGEPLVPHSPNPFQETTGSSFVLADGPTTGLVYSQDGYIITSSFNFVREPSLITVTLSDGRRLAADLIARDQVRKLALLKVDAIDLQVPEWVSHRSIRVGQWAIALGMGFGGTKSSITVGIVSALNRMHGNVIQTDARLSPANYGGPVCDVQGRVMGIAVPMAQRPGELSGVEMYDSGVGFALPKNRVDNIVEWLQQGKSFYRGWLGVSINQQAGGEVIVEQVANPSPLMEVGIAPGDKIIAAAGREVLHFGHLQQALYLIPAGEMVDLKIERGGKILDFTVTLARNTELGPLARAPAEVSEPADVP